MQIDLFSSFSVMSLIQRCYLPLLTMVPFVISQLVPEESLARGCRASRGQFSHETFCHQYYNCWDGRATIEQCPGDLLFNQVTSSCDYPEAVNCAGRIRNPAPFISGGRCLKEWGVFPDPLDCTAFYECAHGRAFRKVCNIYTAFDERYLVCVHAHNVECNGRGGIYGTLSPPVYPIPSASGPRGAKAAIGSSGIDRERQYEKPISQEATFRCPHPRGLYAYALDCTRFWLCREYRPSLLKCPTGQLFDLASLTCTSPEKAQCSTLTPRT